MYYKILPNDWTFEVIQAAMFTGSRFQKWKIAGFVKWHYIYLSTRPQVSMGYKLSLPDALKVLKQKRHSTRGSEFYGAQINSIVHILENSRTVLTVTFQLR